MKWLEIIINVNKEYVELASSIFYMLDVNGVRVDEPITNDVSENLYWDYIDEKLEDKYQESKVSAYFSSIDDFGGKLAFIQKKLKQFKIDNSDMGSCKLEIKEHKQEDWENSWKQYFKPIKITDKVVVKPQWEEYTGENNEIIINIDPGMAFGTGGHETTSMCIKEIEKNLVIGGSLLDVGTGSGILSIAAVLLGFESAVGVDLDLVAVKVAKDNIELNNVPDKVNIIHGDLVSSVSGKYDVVIANIIADAILVLLEQNIKYFLKEEGVFICSGIIPEKEDLIIEKLEENYFEIINIERRGEWVCITSKIKNG